MAQACGAPGAAGGAGHSGASLEDMLSTDVDESVVNALKGSLESQLCDDPTSATAGGGGGAVGPGVTGAPNQQQQLPPQQQTVQVQHVQAQPTQVQAVPQNVQQQQQVVATSQPQSVGPPQAQLTPPPPQVSAPGSGGPTGVVATPVTVAQFAAATQPQVVQHVQQQVQAATVQTTQVAVTTAAGPPHVTQVQAAPPPTATAFQPAPQMSAMHNLANVASQQSPIVVQKQQIQVQVQPDGEPKQPAGLQLVNVQRNLKPAPPRVILSPQIRMATSAPQMLRAGNTITFQPSVQIRPGTLIMRHDQSGQIQLVNMTLPAQQRVTTIPVATTAAPQVARRPAPPTQVVLHQPQGQVTMQAGATMAAPAVRPLTVQTAHQPPATTAGGGQQQQQNTASQMSPNTAKKKCKNFLATLIRLASDQPVQTATNVKALIQGLIDGNIPPEDFTTQLQRELNSSPQPCLVPFLKKSLPHLRQSLMTKELSIEGVRPPPPGSLGPTTTTTTVAAPVSQPSQPPQAIIRAASAGPTTTTTVRLLQPQRLVTVTPPPRAILSQAGHPISATGAMTKSIVVQAPTPTKPSPAPKVPKPPAAPKTPATPKTPAASRNAAQAAAAAAQAAAAAATAAASVAPATPASTTAVATVATTTVAAAASTQAAVAGAGATIPGATTTTGAAEKVRYGSALREDDDINDVAAMGGVNLQEESQRILASSELVGATRSCGDDVFLFSVALEKKITQIAVKHGVDTVDPEVIKLVSHAVQEKLKGYLERLNIASEHRAEPPAFKADAARFEQTTDPRAQLRFVEELDKLERKRHEEHEREMLLRVAKSRSKMEDPEQLKLKQRAKEMQKAEMEEMRQREANMTALQAIGPRKKARLDGTLGGVGSGAGNKAALRPRIKRVNMKDVLFLLETDKNWMRSNFIYKSYLK
ncbi:transcription initiation factor TFIID subunit 4-like isoform X5 [Varroa jacobsoni]|uniref:TAFH domain-containing protein n=1 Tax=Varroa destructor TaxID=109461 RepID=A0A7M7J9U9_VARDE|nr:transcription initiation factor TFIID subunit 4-like isoform X4 [Varroa destructor]XP_022693274.1 transcription initiation factor TFIID subunit 4-like isoform X5 [Varroa jacobsoni]